jgi:hypothetical protein
MLLSGVLFVLFLAGCWLYCLTDAILIPGWAFPGWRKRTWIAFIAVTFVIGAAAWVIARRRWRDRHSSAPFVYQVMVGGFDASGYDQAYSIHDFLPSDGSVPDALARHPARNSRIRKRPDWTGPIGPDDDADFIRQLAERIRGTD